MKPILPFALMLLIVPARAEEGIQLQPPTHDATKTECSACHMAYPPSLMPARSWSAIMKTLDNHFGESAALDEATRADIEAYLTANAADTGGNLPGALRNVPPDAVPLRITEMPWFVGVHGEVSAWRRAKIKSLSNCNVCHTGAENGFFGE